MTLQHGLVDHPTLRRDQAQVMAAMAHVRAEQRLRWPTLVAELTVNFRDPTLPGTDVIGGLSFEPPVLNLRGGAIARARAEQRLAESTTAVDVFRLKAALVDAFGRASGAETRARVLATEVLPSLEEVRRMTEEGYRDGRVDLLRLLDAQRAWLESRLAEVQAEASWQRALAEIERAAGINLAERPRRCALAGDRRSPPSCCWRSPSAASAGRPNPRPANAPFAAPPAKTSASKTHSSCAGRSRRCPTATPRWRLRSRGGIVRAPRSRRRSGHGGPAAGPRRRRPARRSSEARPPPRWPEMARRAPQRRGHAGPRAARVRARDCRPPGGRRRRHPRRHRPRGEKPKPTSAAKRARRQVERATVRSPLEGVVVRVLRRPGELVDGTPATPIMEVADPEQLELVADVPAADLVRVTRGAEATVRVPALPRRPGPGTVAAVSPAVDRATGLGTVRVSIVRPGPPAPTPSSPKTIAPQRPRGASPPAHRCARPGPHRRRPTPTGAGGARPSPARGRRRGGGGRPVRRRRLAHVRRVPRGAAAGDNVEVSGLAAGDQVALDPLGIADGERPSRSAMT